MSKFHEPCVPLSRTASRAVAPHAALLAPQRQPAHWLGGPLPLIRTVSTCVWRVCDSRPPLLVCVSRCALRCLSESPSYTIGPCVLCGRGYTCAALCGPSGRGYVCMFGRPRSSARSKSPSMQRSRRYVGYLGGMTIARSAVIPRTLTERRSSVPSPVRTPTSSSPVAPSFYRSDRVVGGGRRVRANKQLHTSGPAPSRIGAVPNERVAIEEAQRCFCVP